MSSIILAYIIGVLCGMGYMYRRYAKTISNHLRELEEIRLMGAKNDGLIDALCAVNGVDRNNFALVAYVCDGKACTSCDGPDCKHTVDIHHARNFECAAENKYVEKEHDYQKFADEVIEMLNLFCDDDDQISLKKCELEVNMKSILEEFV